MSAFVGSVRELLVDIAGTTAHGPLTLPDGLPDEVRAIVSATVPALLDYQDAAYARLYLDRLKRFVGRRDVYAALFADIARLMADRMMYEDPIRIAQLTLRAGAAGTRVCKFRLDELISALPEAAARPLLDVLQRIGWSHRRLNRRFNASSAWGVRRLQAEAWLRRWRMLTVRYAAERLWVARWLHMIDRALAKQPAAAAAVVDTATMMQGYGDPYRHGLADWHLIIDQLVKPTFDGTLTLPDLAAAIARARAAATPDRRQAALKRAIAQIRASTVSPDAY